MLSSCCCYDPKLCFGLSACNTETNDLLTFISFELRSECDLVLLLTICCVGCIATLQRFMSQTLQPSTPDSTTQPYLSDVTLTSLTVVAVLLTCTSIGISVFICVRYRTRICDRCLTGEIVSSVSSDNVFRDDTSHAFRNQLSIAH